MEQISSMTKQHQSVKTIYNHWTSALDFDAAPRNATVVNSVKYREAKAQC